MKKLKSKCVLAWMLALTLLLCGCGAQQAMYSNLADAASRQEVAQVLESSGISQSSVQQLMQWAASYNAILSGYTPPAGICAAACGGGGLQHSADG